MVFALGEIGPVDYTDVPKFVETKSSARSQEGPPGHGRQGPPQCRLRTGALGIQAAAARANLLEALEDRDAAVRQNAAYALGRLGRNGGAQETIKSLEKRLSKDPDKLVRKDAANGLNELGRPMPGSAVLALFNAFKDDDDRDVRRTALTALVNTVSPDNNEIAKKLADVLRSKQDDRGFKKPDEDIEVYRDVAFAMGNIGGLESKPAVKVLIEGLSDPDVTQRQQSATSLAMIREYAREAIDPLAKALSDDSDPKVRRNAALALSTIKARTDRTLPALLIGMKPSQPEEVRLYSVEAVGFIDEKNPGFVEQAAPTLVRIIQKDKSPRVRQRAVWALGNVKDLEKYVPLLNNDPVES